MSATVLEASERINEVHIEGLVRAVALALLPALLPCEDSLVLLSHQIICIHAHTILLLLAFNVSFIRHF